MKTVLSDDYMFVCPFLGNDRDDFLKSISDMVRKLEIRMGKRDISNFEKRLKEIADDRIPLTGKGAGYMIPVRFDAFSIVDISSNKGGHFFFPTRKNRLYMMSSQFLGKDMLEKCAFLKSDKALRTVVGSEDEKDLAAIMIIIEVFSRQIEHILKKKVKMLFFNDYVRGKVSFGDFIDFREGIISSAIEHIRRKEYPC